MRRKAPSKFADKQMRAAFDLKKAWGDSLDLVIVPDAGHSGGEPGTAKALKEVRCYCPAVPNVARKLTPGGGQVWSRARVEVERVSFIVHYTLH